MTIMLFCPGFVAAAMILLKRRMLVRHLRISEVKKLLFVVWMIVLFVAMPAAAREVARADSIQERLIARCIHASARGKPWLERTLWGLRDQEGGWIGAEVSNSDGSRDLGPMQINSSWVPRIARMVARSPEQVRSWLREDACFNVEAARWLFLNGLSASSDYWSAIGRYHSPRSTRQTSYARSVARYLARRRLLLESVPSGR